MKPVGRVDTLTAPELLKVWETESRENQISKVMMDCTELHYISSAGLRVLLIIVKALGGSSGLVLKGVSPNVMEILENTGFIDLFEVE